VKKILEVLEGLLETKNKVELPVIQKQLKLEKLKSGK
jgi:hypothetical protein